MAGLTRRQFLVRVGGLAGAQLVLPALTGIGAAFGQDLADPAFAERRRLVVLFLGGGNDGLNTVIPMADVAGASRLSVYRKVRPTLAYGPANVMPLDRPADAALGLGLNRRLPYLHRLYREGRLGVVQGVDYPGHSYSHFVSTDIWHSGRPDVAPDSGWLGRHLDRAPSAAGELRGVALGTALPLVLRGQVQQGVAVHAIETTRFGDGTSAEARARHAALAQFAQHPATDPLRSEAGRQAASAVDLVASMEGLAPAPPVADPFVTQLLTARALLESDLGVECLYLAQPGGYDTHAAQAAEHERLLTQLDAGIEAFFAGTVRGEALDGVGPMAPAVAQRTLVLVVSEFGRRIGENSGGTDHGAAGPVLLIGPSPGLTGAALVGGLHGDHPDMGTTLLPADNLTMTTDLRAVYQSVLQHWLADPDPLYAGVGPLPGLFD